MTRWEKIMTLYETARFDANFKTGYRFTTRCEVSGLGCHQKWRGATDHPQRHQDGPKRHQDGPKTTPRGTNMSRTKAQGACQKQWIFQIMFLLFFLFRHMPPPESPKIVPRGTKMALRNAQDAFRKTYVFFAYVLALICSQDAPKRQQRPHHKHQDGPARHQDDPKTVNKLIKKQEERDNYRG